MSCFNQESTSLNSPEGNLLPATSQPRLSLLTNPALILLAIIMGLLAYSLPDYRLGTIDEPWIAEQAFYLASEGTVRSEMFTGYADTESQIFIYHKLLVWLGALAIKLLGLKLWVLRTISLGACLSLIGLMSLHLSRKTPPGRIMFIFSTLILFSCPLFFMRVFIFRPEFLVALCGFGSYFFLDRFISQPARFSLWLSAGLAGLAVLSHLNGLIFIVAGLVILIYKKHYVGAMTFGLMAALVSSFYLIDCMGHLEQMAGQFISSPGNHTANLNPIKAITNLLSEHKRLFRRADIMGISLLYFLALLYQWIHLRKIKTPQNIYTLSLMVTLGLISSNKTPTYAIVLFPFFAMAIASSLIHCLTHPTLGRLRLILPVVFALYLGLGLYANASTALSAKERLEVRHAAVASRLTPDSIVIAPLKFMFNQIDQFDLRSLEAANLLMAENNLTFTFENLNRYARALGATHILFDCEFEYDLGGPPTQVDLRQLSDFTPSDSVAGYLILTRLRDRSNAP